MYCVFCAIVCSRSVMDGFVIYTRSTPSTTAITKKITHLHLSRHYSETNTWIWSHLLFIWIMNECERERERERVSMCCVAIECANKTSPIKNIKQPLKWNCVWEMDRWQKGALKNHQIADRVLSIRLAQLNRYTIYMWHECCSCCCCWFCFALEIRTKQLCVQCTHTHTHFMNAKLFGWN